MTGAAEPADLFGYSRRLGPPVAVLLGLALVEAAVVHLVAVAWAGWRLAAVLGALDLMLLAMLVSLLRSFHRRPVALFADRLVLHAGWRQRLEIPLDAIGGFRAHWTAADLRAPGSVNLALVAWPNLVLDLAEPVRRRGRPVWLVAHCLDDPAAFRARLEPRLLAWDAARGAAIPPAPR